MKENTKEKVSFFVSEGSAPSDTEKKGIVRERLKKPVVFGIMGILFAACLYLIFGGDKEYAAREAITIGINDAVPQASGDGLPEDKGKAYEQETRREKEQQKRDALKTLSDYWRPDSIAAGSEQPLTGQQGQQQVAANTNESNPALGSYQKMQRSIGSFYQQDPAQEALRRENEKLKGQLAQRGPAERRPDRLQLMEQSYQLAAKYFPATARADEAPRSKKEEAEEIPFLEVMPDKKALVSKLWQKVSDSVALRHFAEDRQNGFTSGLQEPEAVAPANSIRACIHQSQKITGEGSIQLRLLQSARIGQVTLPKGHIVTANAKFQASRLQLQVVSIEMGGSIYPVSLSVYDLDGQKGLNLPYAAEVTAVNGTLANMGNTAGGGITINRSAGQQLVSDGAKGLIQGVSGYFSKKVRPQKATLRAGYQLLLVSKEK